MKLLTTIDIARNGFKIGFNDRIVILGSCFADSIGDKLVHAGFNVCANPFGTLYNPVSIADAIERLSGGQQFSDADCVEMGAGAGKWCSFSHHTSFARPSKEEFLENANKSLEAASSFWAGADKLIVTLGTARCWTHGGRVVSNCLKRPGYEFGRTLLSPEETRKVVEKINACGKECLFTVSPIRHLGDGAHANNISKATLLLATEGMNYFPAYEIMMDELRDYRFYSEDMVHPSSTAVQYIWEKFREYVTGSEDQPAIDANEKAWKASQHRKLR